MLNDKEIKTAAEAAQEKGMDLSKAPVFAAVLTETREADEGDVEATLDELDNCATAAGQCEALANIIFNSYTLGEKELDPDEETAFCMLRTMLESLRKDLDRVYVDLSNNWRGK